MPELKLLQPNATSVSRLWDILQHVPFSRGVTLQQKEVMHARIKRRANAAQQGARWLRHRIAGRDGLSRIFLSAGMGSGS